MSNVLLLRAPSNSLDPYESIFSASGYNATSVPVLETVFTNMETLTDVIRRGAQHGAVIVTSGRACEAWNKAVEGLEREQASGQGLRIHYMESPSTLPYFP